MSTDSVVTLFPPDNVTDANGNRASLQQVGAQIRRDFDDTEARERLSYLSSSGQPLERQINDHAERWATPYDEEHVSPEANSKRAEEYESTSMAKIAPWAYSFGEKLAQLRISEPTFYPSGAPYFAGMPKDVLSEILSVSNISFDIKDLDNYTKNPPGFRPILSDTLEHTVVNAALEVGAYEWRTRKVFEDLRSGKTNHSTFQAELDTLADMKAKLIQVTLRLPELTPAPVVVMPGGLKVDSDYVLNRQLELWGENFAIAMGKACIKPVEASLKKQ